MRIRHPLEIFTLCCAVALLTGCASTDSHIAKSSLDEDNLALNETLSPTGLFQPVILDEGAFQNPGLHTNTAVTLDESRHFDTNAVAKESAGMPGENDDDPINVSEFLTPAPARSKLYPLMGDAEQIDEDHFPEDQQEFQPQGLRLFSVPF